MTWGGGGVAQRAQETKRDRLEQGHVKSRMNINSWWKFQADNTGIDDLLNDMRTSVLWGQFLGFHLKWDVM